MCRSAISNQSVGIGHLQVSSALDALSLTQACRPPVLKDPAVLPRLAQPEVPDGGRGRGNYNYQPDSLPPGSSDLVLVARDSLQPYRAPALLKPVGLDEAANYELVAVSGATSPCDPTP